MIRAYRSSASLAAAAVAVAVMGLTGCGGASSPHVASLGASSATTPGSTTTLPKGNPTQLLDEWATCMRTNGTPGLADPTIDANGVIHITMPASDSGPGPVSSRSNSGPGGGPCGAYLTAASTALRGGKPLQKADPAKLEKYSECMRANGVPDFPDPTNGGLQIHTTPGSDLNPQNPVFQSASKLCSKKTGVPGLGGTPPRGAIEETSGNGPNGGPGSGSSGVGVATGGSQSSGAGSAG
jgi:hypothetical protein